MTGAEDKSPGYNCFCHNQDFLWITDENGDDQTITELQHIIDRTVRTCRTEEDDLIAF
jgi:hypothetical protein